MADPQFLSPESHLLRLAASNDGGLQAIFMGKADAQPIPAIKGLIELALCADINAAISQNTVHIKND